ncbi:hypothetical protein G7Y89_g12746 [Cudoniella acicularis]|uniref:Uncharacterized protein n=1 Tax=Cudoniella acicularis TaxID=354080 RepID=A0A8H4RAU6_9HELO|nr:hypothetical protein G7Y89_g12746 [Cudoniella acicularis]
MVEKYSTRALTINTDRLMAISLEESSSFEFALGSRWWDGIREQTFAEYPDLVVASIDGGRVSHRLKWTPSNRSGQAEGDKSAVKRFLTAWEYINPLVSDEEVQPSLVINALIHNANLRLSYSLFELNETEVEFLLDISFHVAPVALLGVPILEFKKIHVQSVGSNLQIHGIVLRSFSGKVPAYERVGYFWTAKDDAIRKILERQNWKCGIRIF